jgi:serine protease Do
MGFKDSRNKHAKRGGPKVTRKFASVLAVTAAILLSTSVYLRAQQAPVAPEPPVPPDPPQVFVLNDGPHLGVTLDDVTPDKAQELKLPFVGGAIVKHVEKNSPAEKAGFQAGDLILEFDGVRVRSVAEMRRLIQETPVGRTVSIKILRNGKPRILNAEIQGSGNSFNFNMPDVHIPRVEEIPPSFGPRHVTLGITAEDLTSQLAQFFGVKDGKGALITAVTKDGPADKAGLKAGDVIIKLNGNPVNDLEGLRFALNHFLDDTRNVTVTIMRDHHEATVHADLTHSRLWEEQTSSVPSPDELSAMEQYRAQIDQERALVQQEVSKQQQTLNSEWQRQLQEQMEKLNEQLKKIRPMPELAQNGDI